MSTESTRVHSLVFADIPTVTEGSAVTFTNTKDTFDDWKLLPTKKPRIKLPPVKKDYLDLPGAHGKIDLTEAYNGVQYDMREDSIELIISEYKVVNGSRITFEALKREIANYLHGIDRAVYLRSDPDVFYIGRWEIDEMLTEENWSTITLHYTLEPFGLWVPATTPRETL